MTLTWSAETCTAEMAVKSNSRSKSRSNPGLPATSRCNAMISSPRRGPLATASTRRRETSIRNDRGKSRAYALRRIPASRSDLCPVSIPRSPSLVGWDSSVNLGGTHRRSSRVRCYRNATAPTRLRRSVDSPHEACRPPRGKSPSPSSRPSSKVNAIRERRILQERSGGALVIPTAAEKDLIL